MARELSRLRSVVSNAHIHAFTHSQREHSQDHGRLPAVFISIHLHKNLHTRWTHRSALQKKPRAAGTSTRADACAFTGNQQLLLSRRVDSLVRVSQQQRWKTRKYSLLCLGAWEPGTGVAGRGNTSVGKTHETTDVRQQRETLR